MMTDLPLEFILSLITVIGGFAINWLGNRNKIKELTLAQQKLESQLEIDQDAADLAKKKGDADLSDHYLEIARQSGEQISVRDQKILDRDTKIDTLAKDVDLLKCQVTELIADKRRLEQESMEKDQRISVLETENTKLSDRVQLLEDTMDKNGWPIPRNGG